MGSPIVVSPADVASHLRKVRALLARPGTWLQNAYTLDTAGRSVPDSDPNACRWCLVSASLWARRQVGPKRNDGAVLGVTASKALVEALEELHGPGLYLTSWQDRPECKLEDVLALIDRAIENQVSECT